MKRHSWIACGSFALLSALCLASYPASAQARLQHDPYALHLAIAQTGMTTPTATPNTLTLRTPGAARAEQAEGLAIPRIITETALGYGMGFMTQLLGMFTGIAVGCLNTGSTRESCGWSMLIGGSLGNVFVTPIGTIIMGNVFRGTGNYWGALLGSLAGTALEYAIGVPFILSAPNRGSIEIALYLSALLPAIGATIGYELQGNARNDELRSTGVVVVPTIAPTMAADGSGINGAVLGARISNL